MLTRVLQKNKMYFGNDRVRRQLTKFQITRQSYFNVWLINFHVHVYHLLASLSLYFVQCNIYQLFIFTCYRCKLMYVNIQRSKNLSILGKCLLQPLDRSRNNTQSSFDEFGRLQFFYLDEFLPLTLTDVYYRCAIEKVSNSSQQ